MAKQAGVLKFTGSLGGISFYKCDGEYRARETTGPSRKTVLTSKRFARTRENAAEFRKAVRAGLLVRRSLQYLMKGYGLADTVVSGRLNAQMLRIIKADTTRGRGERMVCDDHLAMLEDFSFCTSRDLATVFPVGPVTTIDTATGAMRVLLKAFDPQQRMEAPAAATHFKVVAMAASIDFNKERVEYHHQETGFLSLEAGMVDAIDIQHTIETNTGESLLLAMGVVFYACGADGRYERMTGGAMRVLQTATATACLAADRDKLSGGGEVVSSEVSTTLSEVSLSEGKKRKPVNDRKYLIPPSLFIVSPSLLSDIFIDDSGLMAVEVVEPVCSG
jgi:hypothetical protein